MHRRVGILLLLVAAAATSAQAREGFGFAKRAVQMTRMKPPAINVTGSRLRVKATSVRSDRSSDAEALQKLTADAIAAGDARISESDAPDLDVRLTLERLDTDDQWETKTEDEYRQTGTKDEWNQSKGKYEKKPVYGNVPVTKHIKVVDGKLNGSFEIRDGKGRVIDSGSLDQDFRRKYPDGENAPAQSAVADSMLHDAAHVVASRIVATNDRVTVVLPKGSFENFIPLADKGEWDAYLDAVSAVRENRSPDQEAYRQYALAVAKEAVAYSSADRMRASKLLAEALDHYKNAITLNPDEKLFTEAHTSFFGSDAGAPLPRIEASVKAYQSWTSGVPPVARASHDAPPASKKPKVLGNDSVIDMASAGLSDENIKLAIDAAERLDFDTTPDGLIALSKAGVSRGVIAHMQKKVRK